MPTAKRIERLGGDPKLKAWLIFAQTGGTLPSLQPCGALCVQIAQARTLLSVMNDIVHKCNGNALAMVMGDFNSTPESAVYRFIKAGELDCQTVSRKLVSGQIQGTSWPAAMEKVSCWSS